MFRSAADWARSRGATYLKLDSQNINPDACDFYRAMGCELGGFDRFAYRDFPDEIMMLWYLQL